MKKILLALSISCGACVTTTGGDLVTFHATAEGTPASTTFLSGLGYQVTLAAARLHIGAIYLNRSRPTAGKQETPCVEPGIYGGEVLGGLDVDVLDGARQPFPVDGIGTSDADPTGELWLTGGDVNAASDSTTILHVEGTASKAGVDYPFTGDFTIGDNWREPSSNPATPGAAPICRERIISPIPIDPSLNPSQDGTLIVTINPRVWFGSVDFSKLAGGVFPDERQDQQSLNLFTGFRAATGIYTFSWEGPGN